MKRVLMIAAVSLLLASCSDASRNLKVTVEDGGFLWISNSAISPMVFKEGTVESPSQNTIPPNVDLSGIVPEMPKLVLPKFESSDDKTANAAANGPVDMPPDDLFDSYEEGAQSSGTPDNLHKVLPPVR